MAEVELHSVTVTWLCANCSNVHIESFVGNSQFEVVDKSTDLLVAILHGEDLGGKLESVIRVYGDETYDETAQVRTLFALLKMFGG